MSYSTNSLIAAGKLTLLIIMAALIACHFPPVAHAEHRVALLIDNTQHQEAELQLPKPDLNRLSAALEVYGIRSVVKHDIGNEKELRQTIESFADHTPTASTAIVYFAGVVTPGKHNGKDALVLAGTQTDRNRGYPLGNLLKTLHARGGSRLNIAIINSPSAPSLKHEPSAECLMAYANHGELVRSLRSGDEMLASIRDAATFHESAISHRVRVVGRGNEPISPPDRFVLGKNVGDEWVDQRGAVFVWCRPGRYVKGSPRNEPGRYSDEAQKEVVIENGFWISKFEMTLSENLRGRSHRTIAEHKNHPVTMINHDDIRRMTNATMTEEAQKNAGLPQDWQYSLPTEEQWEYAARAGTRGMYYFGDDLSQLPEHANFADRAYYDTGSIYALRADRTLDDGADCLARVGAYEPNPWGLHDIHGNVAEWCIDGAVRGGSWTSTPDQCRLAFRHRFSSREEQNFIGYRLVIQKTPPPIPKAKKKRRQQHCYPRAIPKLR